MSDPTPGNATPGTPPAGNPPAEGFLNSIPEVYRDKSWAKENSASAETFFKFVDNQNTLIGRKGVIIPADNASPEEVEKFHKDLGRPDSPEGYEFKNPDVLKDKTRNAETDKKIKEIFHKIGVPKGMAEKITQGYESFLFEQQKEHLAREAEEDKKFSEFNTKLFGDNRAAVVANAQKILRDTLPKEALPMFDKLPAEVLSLVIAATNGVYAKYGKEDGFRGGVPASPGGETMEQLSAQQRELMGHPGFSDFRHPEHDVIRQKNSIIMQKMRALSSK